MTPNPCGDSEEIDGAAAESDIDFRTAAE